MILPKSNMPLLHYKKAMF